MFYTYILISATSNKRYVGQTSNLYRRLVAHNSGESKYTKSRGPWILMHYELYSSRGEATKRERFLKSGKSREFIDSLTK